MARRVRRSSPPAPLDPYHRQEKCEPGPHPAWIDDLRKQVRASVHARKPELRSKKILARDKRRPVVFGPVQLPVSWLCSSRWCETRTNLPLARNRETWRIAWLFWRTSQTYAQIKESIERFGMREPIRTDYYLNWDPTDDRVVPHSCLVFSMKTFRDHPFVVGVGNERSLMAQFEWGWTTMPAIVCVRDYGHDSSISAALRTASKLFPRQKYERPIVPPEAVKCMDARKN